MLYNIRSLEDLKAISPPLSQSVCQEAKRILKIIDEAYHENARWICSVYIGTGKRDFQNFRKLWPHLLIEDYEFLDWITGEQEEDYVSILYILSADDTVSIIMPEKYLPEEILQENHRRKMQ